MSEFLTPDEVAIIKISLRSTLDDCKVASKALKPEAIKDMAEMMHHAESALTKIQKVSGLAIALLPYQKGNDLRSLTINHKP